MASHGVHAFTLALASSTRSRDDAHSAHSREILRRTDQNLPTNGPPSSRRPRSRWRSPRRCGDRPPCGEPSCYGGRSRAAPAVLRRGRGDASSLGPLGDGPSACVMVVSRRSLRTVSFTGRSFPICRYSRRARAEPGLTLPLGRVSFARSCPRISRPRGKRIGLNRAQVSRGGGVEAPRAARSLLSSARGILARGQSAGGVPESPGDDPRLAG